MSRDDNTANCKKCYHKYRCYKYILDQFDKETGEPDGGCGAYQDNHGVDIDDDMDTYPRDPEQVAKDAIRSAMPNSNRNKRRR